MKKKPKTKKARAESQPQPKCENWPKLPKSKKARDKKLKSLSERRRPVEGSGF